MSLCGTNPNVLDLCRLCLGKDETLIPVFDSLDCNQILCDKIRICLSVQISIEDRFSRKICASCLIKVDSFYEFRSIASESQKVLDSWLHNNELSILTDEIPLGKELSSPSKAVDIVSHIDDDADLVSKIANEVELVTQITNHSDLVSQIDDETVSETRIATQAELVAEITTEAELVNRIANEAELVAQIAAEVGLKNRKSPTLELSDHSSCGSNQSDGDSDSESTSSSSSGSSIETCCSDESGLRRKRKRRSKKDPKNKTINLLPVTEVAGPSGLKPTSNEEILQKLISVRIKRKEEESDANETFLSKRNHLQQKSIKRKNSDNQCEICGKKFLTKAKLSDHFNTHTTKYVCNECPYSSKSSSNFRVHLMKHNKQYLIECEECGKGFYQLSYYREHKAMKHSSEIVVNKCKVCEKAFHSRFYLNQHMKVHTPGFVKKTYQCEVCGKTFLSWKGVKRHIKTIHEGNRYKCDLCGKEVTCLQSLKNHKKIHSGEKMFVCDICGKGFITSNNLVVHERIHSGEKPYKCDICHKSFNQQTTLKVHKRCHTGEKPYHCQSCSKSFATRTHMKKHSKVHIEKQMKVT